MNSLDLLHMGYQGLLSEIQRIKQQNRENHCWLITGPKGVGKRTLCHQVTKLFLADADSFDVIKEAKFVNLDRQITAKSHPDYMWLPVGATVQEVRQLNVRCRQTRILAPWRVVMIPQADELGLHALNALLKSIEEALPQTVFLLTAGGHVSKTLSSRCTQLVMRPLERVQFQRLIFQEVDQSVGSDPLFHMMCQGCIGRAYRLRNEMALVHQAWALFSRCRQQPVSFPKNWAEQTQEHWETIQEIFFLWCHYQAVNGAFAQRFFLRVMKVWEGGQNLFREYRDLHTDWRTVLYGLCSEITRILPLGNQTSS